MSWDYAEMSKAAKVAGGPEKYVDSLVQSGRQEMYPWILVATLATGITTHYAPKVVDYFKSKWVTKDEAQKAREEIITGINQYNQLHPDENDNL